LNLRRLRVWFTISSQHFFLCVLLGSPQFNGSLPLGSVGVFSGCCSLRFLVDRLLQCCSP
jgi:hypothetical protein